jgi:hypothetical protein
MTNGFQGMVVAGVHLWKHQGINNVRHSFHRDYVVKFLLGLQRMYGEKQPDGKMYELPPDSKQEYFIHYTVSQVK